MCKAYYIVTSAYIGTYSGSFLLFIFLSEVWGCKSRFCGHAFHFLSMCESGDKQITATDSSRLTALLQCFFRDRRRNGRRKASILCFRSLTKLFIFRNASRFNFSQITSSCFIESKKTNRLVLLFPTYAFCK